MKILQELFMLKLGVLKHIYLYIHIIQSHNKTIHVIPTKGFGVSEQNIHDGFNENEIVLTSIELEYENKRQRIFFERQRNFLAQKAEREFRRNIDNESVRSSIGTNRKSYA